MKTAFLEIIFLILNTLKYAKRRRKVADFWGKCSKVWFFCNILDELLNRSIKKNIFLQNIYKKFRNY